MTKSITVIALAALAIGPAYAMWPQKQLDPPVIGTVSLERVFNGINRRSQAETELVKQLTPFQDQAEESRAKAERLKADLELLVPGTEKHEQAEKEWIDTVLDYRAVVAFLEAKLDVVRAQARVIIYEAITEAAAQYADDNNIDFIVTDDSRLPLQEGNDIQVVQQLALRRLVYANPSFDITDELIGWMNSP